MIKKTFKSNSMDACQMVRANSVFAQCPTTIFETMSRMAQAHGAVNLGQGFPEGLEPAALIQRLAQAAQAGPHQYPSMMGIADLRQAVARHESRCWSIATDESQVMVTSGGTEALAACLFGLIEPGDEVVLIEPLYDSYMPIVLRAGGVPRLVRLRPPDWRLPRHDLAQAFGPRTRLLVLNSPANPCGAVFDADDMAFIANLLEVHDCLAVCDEVYEHLTFDARPHVSLRSLTKRAVKVGSAGKIFSVTGWKVGWVVADAPLLAPIAKAHQYLTFTTPPAQQQAIAWGLEQMQDEYLSLSARLQDRRDRLAIGLSRIGFDVLPTGGSYFLCADFRPLGFAGPDGDFCRWITEKAGVAAIPISAFYVADGPTSHARFCFAKTESVIDLALQRLTDYFHP